MYFLKAVAVGALALVQTVVAQSSVLAFTISPTTVTVDQPVTVTYIAPNLSAPVTIVLRKGDPASLDTIGVITSNAVNGTYTWYPSHNLIPASDYALQILQGAEVNYGPLFTLNGAVSPSTTSDLYTIQTINPSSGGAVIPLSTSDVYTIETINPSANASLIFDGSLPTAGPYTYPGNGSVVYLTTTPCASIGTGLLPGYAGSNATFSSPTLSATAVAPTVTSVDISTATAATPAGSASSSDAVAPVSTGAADTLHKFSAFGFVIGIVGGAFALL